MSDVKIHIEQAKHNKELALNLGKGDFRDWTIICAFYAALNFFEAGLLKKGNGDHTETLFDKLRQELGSQLREKSVHALRDRLADSNFPKLRGKLSQLRHMSEAVRYLEKTGNKCGNKFITEGNAGQAISDLSDIEDEIKKA
ncbi:MAG: hypothetical protein HYW62_04385 [Candidatus Levybacteria bacterium]|nr:hypothetical protein [Candidatus Levybacteria bacterium]